MISNKYMTEGQKQLYQDTFHDTEEFLSYLSTRDDAVTYSNDDGTSQVTIVDKDIVIDKERYKGKFMIGACTKSELRGRGLFARLFSEIVRSLDADILLTYPDDSRRGYYAKLGFEVFNEVEYHTIDNVVEDATIIECYDAKLLKNIYDKYVENYDVYQYRDIDAFADIVRAVRADNGKIYLIGHKGKFSYAIVTDKEIVEYTDIEAIQSVSAFVGKRYSTEGNTPYAIYKSLRDIDIQGKSKLFFSRYY